jgi:hypothetical protein
MRVCRNGLLLAVLAAVGLAAMGCWYRPPKTEEWYAGVSVGMSKDEVIKVLGPPTATLASEMFYIYDDPKDPVRFRFILNDEGLVIAKYYESKKDLAKRTEQTKGEESTAATPSLPSEPKYPGGPLPRFEKKPGQNY